MWKCSLCLMRYITESGLRKHMWAIHKATFHRKEEPTLLTEAEAAHRLEADRKRQANSKQRRLIRAMRSAGSQSVTESATTAATVTSTETVTGPTEPLIITGEATNTAVSDMECEIFEWPDFFNIGQVPKTLREIETQTDTATYADACEGSESTQVDKGTNTRPAKPHEVPGLPSGLSMSALNLYLQDNPTVSARQAAIELLPVSTDNNATTQTEFQALLAALMYVQRETVKTLRNGVAAASRARQDQRPAMLQALNATTNELAERVI